MTGRLKYVVNVRNGYQVILKYFTTQVVTLASLLQAVYEAVAGETETQDQQVCQWIRYFSFVIYLSQDRFLSLWIKIILHYFWIACSIHFVWYLLTDVAQLKIHFRMIHIETCVCIFYFYRLLIDDCVNCDWYCFIISIFIRAKYGRNSSYVD